jgi:3-isopropylmalate dehydrogenase
MTKQFKVCRIPGDGIGPDVMQACMNALEPLDLPIKYIDAEAGWSSWEKHRTTVPTDTWEVLKATDCCLFSAITSKRNVSGFKSAIVWIRQDMGLYSNLRPVKHYPGVPTSVKEELVRGMNISVCRENVEGLYAGVEYAPPLPQDLMGLLPPGKYPADQTAVSFRIFTVAGCERILRFAFSLAKKQKRQKVTVVDKPNVIRETGNMFIQAAERIHLEYPNIDMEIINVDDMGRRLVRQPTAYEVIAITNTFGDIISDIGAELMGGLGIAPSGSYGDNYALFEPIHGSAPKYAGKNVVNPIAQILSAKMMLEFLELHHEATVVENAVKTVIQERKVLTYDLGGKASTTEVAKEIQRIISETQ